MSYRRSVRIRIHRISAAVIIAAAVLSCKPEPATDYQAYIQAAPERVVLVVNGHSESLSGFDPAADRIYNDIQLVGHSGTNKAVPSDILISGDSIYLILSGQNSIEEYDKKSLDYVDGGRHYFKNGYNPMLFIPVPGSSWVFVPGFESDEVQPVNLNTPQNDYGFVRSFEPVTMPSDAHSETKTAASARNAAGDNKKRGGSGGAVLVDGASSRLYLSNVRYDPSILLKTPYSADDAVLAEYPADSGRNVKAGGYFREATISIFGFDAGAMTDGASDAALNFRLIREISLEDLLYTAISGGGYFPGDGLNPQSAFILDGMLNIVCTGTNGGSARRYTTDEYIPEGFSPGDIKPGTGPDDGLIIIADISDPDNPVYLKHLEIGGSPAGFRNAIDTGRKIVYLAGVGGLQSYRYGSAAADYAVLHPYSSMLLAADNPENDYYSGLCYDETGDVLYISFYSEDSLKKINAGGSAAAPVYTAGGSFVTGDGPGALCIMENL